MYQNILILPDGTQAQLRSLKLRELTNSGTDLTLGAAPGRRAGHHPLQRARRRPHPGRHLHPGSSHPPGQPHLADHRLRSRSEAGQRPDPLAAQPDGLALQPADLCPNGLPGLRCGIQVE